MMEVVIMRNRFLNILYFINDKKPKITSEIGKDVWNVLTYPFLILLIYNYTALIRNGQLSTLSMRIIFFFMYFLGWPVLMAFIIYIIGWINIFADFLVSSILKFFLPD